MYQINNEIISRQFSILIEKISFNRSAQEPTIQPRRLQGNYLKLITAFELVVCHSVSFQCMIFVYLFHFLINRPRIYHPNSFTAANRLEYASNNCKFDLFCFVCEASPKRCSAPWRLTQFVFLLNVSARYTVHYTDCICSAWHCAYIPL